MDGEHVRIRGIVQGVGFRATVEDLADAYGMFGWVRNDGRDVLVALAGDSADHDRFLRALMRALPPRARVDAVERSPADVGPASTFVIAPTRRG